MSHFTTESLVPVLMLDALPQDLRENWHIYLGVREHFRTQFAHSHAQAITGIEGLPQTREESDQWCAAFDDASNFWLAANPIHPMWEGGKWPKNADIYYGNESLQEAISLARITQTPANQLAAIMDRQLDESWRPIVPQQEKDAVVHMNVPKAVKNAWVRQSQREGMKLSDWLAKKIDG